MYIGIDYHRGGCIAGLRIDFFSLMPITKVDITVNENGILENKVYKTRERVNSLSYEAYAKYTADDWFVSAKTVLGSNLTQTLMVGGYGVTSTNSLNGHETYAPIRNSTTCINALYCKKWKPGIFVGYMKNLGTGVKVSNLYGM